MESPLAWVTKVAINKAKRSWVRRNRHVDSVNADVAGQPQIDGDSHVDLWDDGCNDNGKGLFSATADGQVQLESGNTTNMGCIDTELIDLFSAGTFGANRWGRTSDGSLVLTNGVVVVEFSLG